MIRCIRCDNDTRTSTLVTTQGEVMLAGTLGADPQPIVAQVCSACGHIELYAPQSFQEPQVVEGYQSRPLESSSAEIPLPAS